MPPHFSVLRRGLLLTGLGAGLQACGAIAPASPNTRPAAPVPSIPPTVNDPAGAGGLRLERFELPSVDGQRHYQVQLAVPTAPPPATGYPLLILLDGNAAFDAVMGDTVMATWTHLATAGRPVAIAAIGYRSDQVGDVAVRAFDYTPPVPGRDTTWDDERRQRAGGGADQFLDLLERQMLPEIRRRVPSDPACTTFWGHSYGGLLVLYTLFTRPQLFPRYAAADASLWWHDGFILQVEDRARALPADRRTELLLMAGGPRSEAGPSSENAAPAQITDSPQAVRVRRRAALTEGTPLLAERQSRRAGLDVQWRPFPGVGHGALRAASLPPTLELAAR